MTRAIATVAPARRGRAIMLPGGSSEAVACLLGAPPVPRVASGTRNVRGRGVFRVEALRRLGRRLRSMEEYPALERDPGAVRVGEQW